MSLGAFAVYLIIALLVKSFNGTLITMTIITAIIHFGANQFMKSMSQPQLTESGSILDSGTDLNMEGGIAEWVKCFTDEACEEPFFSLDRHVKDIIILTSGTQILSLLSNWFWFLLLLGPIRAIYMLWGSVIKPWLSQKSEQDENPQTNDKKQKKMERRMKRVSSR